MGSLIEIAVRIRPQSQPHEGIYVCTRPHTRQIIVGNQLSFGADYALPLNCSQSVLYDTCVSQKIDDLIDGQNISFIGFGKSGTGKTYSLLGLDSNLSEFSGVVPQAASQIFNKLWRIQQQTGLEHKVLLSFFEITNGKIKDLLMPAYYGYESLPKKKDTGSNLPVDNVVCPDLNEFFNYLNYALQQRATISSLSHCFFVFTICQQPSHGKPLTKVSRATFVDLGSSISQFYDRVNNPLLYANSNKNIGLIYISNILSMLAENDYAVPGSFTVPVLGTLLLKTFSMSHHSLLLCCISPAPTDHIDTVNYLNLVERFRYIFMTGDLDTTRPLTAPELYDLNENGSVKGDTFGLEFAASQLQQLVANAENIFQKLLNGDHDESRTKIEQWLCRKQECEECFHNDSSLILGEKTLKSLERIDEVTESGSKLSTRNSTSLSESENESLEDYDDIQRDDTCDESFTSKKGGKSKFIEKLELHKSRFKNMTDSLVDSFLDVSISGASSTERNDLNSVRRRRSVLAWEVLPLPTCSYEYMGTSLAFKEPKGGKLKHHDKISRNMMSLGCSKEKLPSLGSDNLISAKKDQEKLSSNHSSSVKSKTSLKGNSQNAVCLPKDKQEEFFREEIINLRDTRDVLVQKRRSLDSKLNKDKLFSLDEERKFLEVDEAIEAIDAAIELKNELLCGHGIKYESEGNEQSEIMILDRLMKLPEPEMRRLLYRYFNKVVDLRDSGRKMEQELTDSEYQNDIKTWKIQALCNSLQQVRNEAERQLVLVHREHEEKLNFLFEYYKQKANTENSSSESRQFDSMESFANNVPVTQSVLSIPQQNLKKLQGSLTHTTKVTRKKNKLIIHQQKSKKS